MSNTYELMVVAVLSLAACASPEEKAANALLARQAADRKVAEIADGTERKEAHVLRRAAEDMAEVARAGERRAADERLNADRADNDAAQALWEGQERARADASRELDVVGRNLVDLRPALESKLSPNAVTIVMTDIEAKSAAVRKNIVDLDGCSARDLESIKSSIRASLTDLEDALTAARKRT